MFDALWTCKGNILYAAINSQKVVVIYETGKVIQHTVMTEPKRLSVTTDGIIYLVDKTDGVYQSTDDGVSWKLIIDSTPGWLCWQTIKVTVE